MSIPGHAPIPRPIQEALFALPTTSGDTVDAVVPNIPEVSSVLSSAQIATSILKAAETAQNASLRPPADSVRPFQPVLPVPITLPPRQKTAKPFGGRRSQEFTHDSDLDDNWVRRPEPLTPELIAEREASLASKGHADLAAAIRRSSMRVIAQRSNGDPRTFAALVRNFKATHAEPVQKKPETA